jgi:Pentapeptide repeats (9 copies)
LLAGASFLSRVGADCNIFLAGPKEFNRWRSENPDRNPDLEGVTCSRLEFANVKLDYANLTNAKFFECNFSGANFDNAKLTNTEFLECKLDNARFSFTGLNNAVFLNVTLNGADFQQTPSLPRIAKITLSAKSNSVGPKIDPQNVPPIDRYLSWENLRFLSHVQLFLPAYMSLFISIFYLSAIALYNSLLGKLNTIVSINSPGIAGLQFDPILPGWRHTAVVIAFSALSIASTTYLAAPSRSREFSFDQWVWELRQPALLYHHASWSRRPMRITCFVSLVIGGSISLLLLLSAVIKQTMFILTNV